MNIVDYIIAGVLLISSVHGWYIGLVLSFFNIAGYIIAGILAKYYYKMAALWIGQLTQIDENIKTFIDENIGNNIIGSTSDVINANTNGATNLPVDDLNKMMDYLPNSFKTPLLENINNFTSKVTDFVLNLLGMVTVFIVALIAIKILVLILNTIAKMPGLKEINRGGGLILGFIKGAIVILIVFAILTLYIGANPTSALSGYVLDSMMGAWIYNHNILFWILRSELFSRISFS